MAFSAIHNVAIRGISAAVPKTIESNWEYPFLSESEKKLLIKTTGVEFRRRAEKGMATSDLCYEAAKKLIDELGWSPSEIDALIFVSQSSDYYLPATAIILQDRLGLPTSCMALDVGLGCSGYVYGLSVLSSILSATGLKKALLMAGDVSSATCSFEDKSTYPLFGDAGTVTALEFDDSAQSMTFELNSDGSGYEAIIIPHGGVRNLATKASFDKKEISPGIQRADLNLALNGLDVFNFSVTKVPKSINAFLAKTNTSPDNYDYFLMHQANLLMNETIRKKTKFDKEQVPYSIQQYGNTSSASIPLTIVAELRDRTKEERLNVLMAGFGVGLSWGIASVELAHIKCPKIIEV